MKPVLSKQRATLTLALFIGLSLSGLSPGQEQPQAQPEAGQAQLKLRKTLKTREHQGRAVEGEERVIGPGDSLWRILIQEKGLSQRLFARYLAVIGSLNPHLKRPDTLQLGDRIFIPLRPDELLGVQVPPSDKGEAKVYRVKRGDYLYKILLESFDVRGKKEIESLFSRVKELNPHKKNWDLLFVGEGILFPGPVQDRRVAAASPPEPAGEIVGLDYGKKLSVQDNLHLLEQVIGALENEMQRGGEEVLPFQEGTIRIDRDLYPVIHNPKTARKVMLDLEDRMPSSLRAKLETQGAAVSLVSMKKGASLHEAVNSLLSRLGFQSLPPDRPVVIQDRGIGIQVTGEWMVTAPEETGGRQEVLVISVIDAHGRTPDYLRDYLSSRGMKLREILLPFTSLTPLSLSPGSGRRGGSEIESWPRDKTLLVDAFLKNYQIAFSTGQQISVLLREGIRLDTKVDRLFEFGGKKVALLFRADEVKKALLDREGITAFELDLESVSSRELIARLLQTVGERTAYREHRFPATEGGAKDRLLLTVSGFFLPDRSALLTDREIPKDLLPFFAQRGIRVVYFQ